MYILKHWPTQTRCWQDRDYTRISNCLTKIRYLPEYLEFSTVLQNLSLFHDFLPNPGWETVLERKQSMVLFKNTWHHFNKFLLLLLLPFPLPPLTTLFLAIVSLLLNIFTKEWDQMLWFCLTSFTILNFGTLTNIHLADKILIHTRHVKSQSYISLGEG
jgi:hypothetical protein